MKKTIILILSALLSVPSAAQIYKHLEENRYHRDGNEHYYGLRLGLNLSSISSGDINLDADAFAGLYLGANYGIQLSRMSPVWLEVGLAYSEKGGIGHIDGERLKYRLSYLEMPLVIKYSIEVGDFHVQPLLGGYLAVGITGKTKDYRTRDSYSSFDTFRRFDGGLRIGCGAEYQMIYLEVGCDFGLANTNKDDFDTAHNRCLYISAGVNF